MVYDESYYECPDRGTHNAMLAVFKGNNIIGLNVMSSSLIAPRCHRPDHVDDYNIRTFMEISMRHVILLLFCLLHLARFTDVKGLVAPVDFEDTSNVNAPPPSEHDANVGETAANQQHNIPSEPPRDQIDFRDDGLDREEHFSVSEPKESTSAMHEEDLDDGHQISASTDGAVQRDNVSQGDIGGDDIFQSWESLNERDDEESDVEHFLETALEEEPLRSEQLDEDSDSTESDLLHSAAYVGDISTQPLPLPDENDGEALPKAIKENDSTEEKQLLESSEHVVADGGYPSQRSDHEENEKSLKEHEKRYKEEEALFSPEHSEGYGSSSLPLDEETKEDFSTRRDDKKATMEGERLKQGNEGKGDEPEFSSLENRIPSMEEEKSNQQRGRYAEVLAIPNEPVIGGNSSQPLPGEEEAAALDHRDGVGKREELFSSSESIYESSARANSEQEEPLIQFNDNTTAKDEPSSPDLPPFFVEEDEQLSKQQESSHVEGGKMRSVYFGDELLQPKIERYEQGKQTEDNEIIQGEMPSLAELLGDRSVQPPIELRTMEVPTPEERVGDGARGEESMSSSGQFGGSSSLSPVRHDEELLKDDEGERTTSTTKKQGGSSLNFSVEHKSEIQKQPADKGKYQDKLLTSAKPPREKEDRATKCERSLTAMKHHFAKLLWDLDNKEIMANESMYKQIKELQMQLELEKGISSESKERFATCEHTLTSMERHFETVISEHQKNHSIADTTVVQLRRQFTELQKQLESKKQVLLQVEERLGVCEKSMTASKDHYETLILQLEKDHSLPFLHGCNHSSKKWNF